MSDEGLPNLSQLLAERPKTKMGQIKAAWPYIRRALDSGHKLKAIWERLRADGVEIHYNRLSECVKRLERSGFESRTAIATAPRPSPRAGEKRASPKADPAANLRERLDRPTAFEYGGTGSKDDLI
jgi:hypothetical protein